MILPVVARQAPGRQRKRQSECHAPSPPISLRHSHSTSPVSQPVCTRRQPLPLHSGHGASTSNPCCKSKRWSQEVSTPRIPECSVIPLRHPRVHLRPPCKRPFLAPQVRAYGFGVVAMLYPIAIWLSRDDVEPSAALAGNVHVMTGRLSHLCPPKARYRFPVRVAHLPTGSGSVMSGTWRSTE